MILEYDSLTVDRGWSIAPNGSFSCSNGYFSTWGANDAWGGPYKLLPHGSCYAEARFWCLENSQNWVMLRAPTLNITSEMYAVDNRPAVLMRGDGRIAAYEGSTGVDLPTLSVPPLTHETSRIIGIHWFKGGYAIYVDRIPQLYREYAWAEMGAGEPGYVRWSTIVLEAHAVDFVVASTPPPWPGPVRSRLRR